MPEIAAQSYVERATAAALAGVEADLATRGGSLKSAEGWADENGHWLRVVIELDRRPDALIHYARVVRPAAPATGPEFEGAVYATGVMERIDTRLHRLEPTDGVITL